MQEIGKLGAQPASSSISTFDNWKDDDKYQRLVGRLIYLIITRPNFAYVTIQMNQHMHAAKAGFLGILRGLQEEKSQRKIIKALRLWGIVILILSKAQRIENQLQDTICSLERI